jgi:hypothetical protein
VKDDRETTTAALCCEHGTLLAAWCSACAADWTGELPLPRRADQPDHSQA